VLDHIRDVADGVGGLAAADLDLLDHRDETWLAARRDNDLRASGSALAGRFPADSARRAKDHHHLVA
jgi:hypothetical protein